MTTCPTELERERFLAGALSEETSVRLAHHRDECDVCRSWFAMAQEDEGLLAPLRQALAEDPGGDALASGDATSAPAIVAGDLDAQGLARYRIRRRLGAGGMGIVYEAEQKKPQRLVALKVVRPGFASEALLRRFEFEAEILGRLDHPGIARIFDAGTFGAGDDRQPFFAMELVRGRALHQFLDEEQPALKDLLRLFIRIGNAVAHAHQKGVIHRDLKTANILVTDQGQPKVLDFGVARATDGDVQQMTMETDAGKVVGTLPYMSPEQVAGDADALDVRSDVYSLGVLYYEMLAGVRPHDLAGKSMLEAARKIREEEPRRLGTLRAELRGDLETIGRKALEKDPARRYGSVLELVADVERYLAHEPISARPPTTIYQLVRFSQRHRALVGGVIGVVLVLAAGVVSTRVQWWIAELARNTAQAETRRAQAVSDFLMKCLVQASPNQRRGKVTTIEDVFAEAAVRVDQDFADEPEVRAELHGTIGWTLMQMGSHADAELHLQQSLTLWRELRGNENLRVAGVLASLASLAGRTGRTKDALPLAKQALALRRSASPAAWSRERHDRRWELGTNCELVALAEYYTGNIEAAIGLFREAIDHRRASAADHPADLCLTLTNFAQLLSQEGRHLEEAEARVREAGTFLRERLSGLAQDREDVRHGRRQQAETTLVLSSCLALQGDEDAALPHLLEAADRYAVLAAAGGDGGQVGFGLALDAWEKHRLPVVQNEVTDQADLAFLWSYQALLRILAGRDQAAQPVVEKAEELARQVHPTQAQLAGTARLLARSWVGLGNPDRAEDLLVALMDGAEDDGGPGSLARARLRVVYGEYLLRQEGFAAAEAQLLDAHGIFTDSLGADNADARAAAAVLVRVYEALEDPDRAAVYRDSP